MNDHGAVTWTAVLAATAIALSGCSMAADKAGGDTTTLRLATIDGEVTDSFVSQGVFVDSLRTLSHGRLDVDVTASFADGAADAESRLVEAIAAGEVDGGWPATRAFARAGIDAFRVLEAPLTITSYDMLGEVVSGPIGEELLARLEGTGIVGLGLAVGPLRRPFSGVAPLLSPEDWAGERVRTMNSPVQDDAISALGAEPVPMLGGWIDQLRAGTLQAAEADIIGYSSSGFMSEAKYVTGNVVLWPKVPVFSMNEERLDDLTDEQEGWIREAARRAVDASVNAHFDETDAARLLCGRGIRFVSASDDQLAALRERVAPVIDGLTKDPDDAHLLADIRQLADQFPDEPGPALSAECSEPIDDRPQVVPTTRPPIPDGTYRTSVSEKDLAAVALGNGPGWTGTWTLTFTEGRFTLACRPLHDPRRDCGNSGVTSNTVLESGVVYGNEREIYFCTAQCSERSTMRFIWHMHGDQLMFGGGPSAERTVTPWHRVDGRPHPFPKHGFILTPLHR